MSNTKNRAESSLATVHPELARTARPAEQEAGTLIYRPQVNMYDLSDRYEMHVDLPGSSSEAIEASVHEGVLSIRAAVPNRYPKERSIWRIEYGVGDFQRQIRLGEDIDTERLSAKYEHGVLTLMLPKLPERQPRRVPIVEG